MHTAAGPQRSRERGIRHPLSPVPAEGSATTHQAMTGHNSEQNWSIGRAGHDAEVDSAHAPIRCSVRSPAGKLVMQREDRWCSAEKRADGGGEGRRIIDPREVCGAGLDDDSRVVEQRCCFPYRGGWHHRVLVPRVEQDRRGELRQGTPRQPSRPVDFQLSAHGACDRRPQLDEAEPGTTRVTLTADTMRADRC